MSLQEEMKDLREELKELKSTGYDIVANLQSTQLEYKRKMDKLNKHLEEINRQIAEKDQRLRNLLEDVATTIDSEKNIQKESIDIK